MKTRPVYRLRVADKWLTLADQAVVSGSAFATNLLLARTLGPADYGQFSEVVLAQLFLLSVQQAAVSSVYQVHWPGLRPNRQRPYSTGLLYGQIGWLLALALLALPLVGFGLFKTLAPGPAAVATALFLLQDCLRKMLLTQQRAGEVLFLDVLTNGSQLLLLAGAWWAQTLSLPLAWWIIGGTYLPSVALGLVYLRPGRFRQTDLWLVVRQHRRHGGWLVLSALVQWSAGNFFVVGAGWWLGSAALGALRLVQYLFGLLNVALQAVENYVLPRAVRYAHSGPALTSYLGRVLTKTGAVSAPILLLLVLGAEPLMTLAGGPDYRPFAYIVPGLAGVYVLILSGYPIRIALRVRLLNRAYFVGYALAAGFSLGAAPYLISHYAVWGVLLGLFLTQFIQLTYWLVVLHRHQIIAWRSFTLSSARPIRPE